MENKLWFKVVSFNSGEISVSVWEGPGDQSEANKKAVEGFEKDIRELEDGEWIDVFPVDGTDIAKIKKFTGAK